MATICEKTLSAKDGHSHSWKVADILGHHRIGSAVVHMEQAVVRTPGILPAVEVRRTEVVVRTRLLAQVVRIEATAALEDTANLTVDMAVAQR